MVIIIILLGIGIFVSRGKEEDGVIIPISIEEAHAMLQARDRKPDKELMPISREMRERLYGHWKVLDGLGYSLKYKITNGRLCDGTIYISQSEYREENILIPRQYYNPIFLYYTETMEEMKEDELFNYSGIEGMDADEECVVIFAFGQEVVGGDYEYLRMEFLLIDEYVVSVHLDSFHGLENI